MALRSILFDVGDNSTSLNCMNASWQPTSVYNTTLLDNSTCSSQIKGREDTGNVAAAFNGSFEEVKARDFSIYDSAVGISQPIFVTVWSNTSSQASMSETRIMCVRRIRWRLEVGLCYRRPQGLLSVIRESREQRVELRWEWAWAC